MKKIKIIYISALFAISLFFIQSCENVIDGQLPYQEKLVIKCILEEGKPTDNIFIVKNLPPMYTEYYNKDTPPDIIIKNAVGYISDSEKSYPLEYVANTTYKAVGLIPKEGVTYKLSVSWNGHTATGQTNVPAKPEIISVILKEAQHQQNYYGTIAEIKFKGLRNVSYIAETYHITQEYDKSGYYNYGNAVMIRNNASSDTSIVNAVDIMDYYTNSYASINVLVFPPEFLDFYDSKYSGGNSPDGIFSTSGINVKWNIKGDGIGLFLGKNVVPVNIDDYIKK